MGEGRLCFPEEDASSLGHLDPPAHTVEQRSAITVLEGAHRRAYRGWCQVERRSGLRQMLSFRHSDEDAQLLESHGDRSIGSNGTYDISRWNAQSGVSTSRCIEDIERKGESRW